MSKYFTLFITILFLQLSFTLGQVVPLRVTTTFVDINDQRTYEQAKHFFDLKDHTTALPMFEELVEIYPQEPLFKYYLAQCYINSNNEHKSAIPLLKELKSSYPNSPELYYWLGKAYMFNYEFDNAIAELEFYVKKFGSEKNVKAARLEIINCKNAKNVMQNPVSVNVVNLGNKVNTIFSEYAPVVVEEDRTLFLTFRGDSTAFDNNNFGLLSGQKNEYFEDIFISKQNAGGEWQVPQRAGEPFNTNRKEHHDASVSISHNRQYMFIYRNKNGKESGDILMLKKNGDKWEYYKDLSGVNSTNWEGSACMTADEKYIYFSSDRPGTLGDKDLWRAVKQPDGSYGAVTNLGNKINTPLAEDAPFVSFDSKKFYFSSQGHNSIGGYDLFVCDIKPDGSLGPAVNVGYPVNSLGDDIYFSTTLDGTKAYLSSNRPGSFGQLDLYEFEIAGLGTATHLFTLNGVVKWENRFVPCDVQVFDEKNELEGSFQVAEHDGLFKIALTGGEKYKIYFNSPDFETYQYDLDLRNLKTNETGNIEILLKPKPEMLAKLESKAIEHDKKMELAAQVKSDVKTKNSENVQVVVDLVRVFFDYDQTLVKAEFHVSLNNLVSVLKKNKDIKINIIGHTDSKGSDEYNLNLSRRRANAVANYLVVRGISRSRINIIAKGESEPIAPNENADGSDSPQGRAKNRRVEFEIPNSEKSNSLKVNYLNNWPK